jgi:manganese/zinc/iron transport system permease protein
MVRRIQRENLLKDLYVWGERRGEDWHNAVPWPLLMGLRGQTRGQLNRLALRLQGKGLLLASTAGSTLTDEGLSSAAGIVRKHRLWELYLTHRLELPADHVHRDADAMEHTLSEEALAEIDEILGYPTLDPHGQPIPRSTPTEVNP